MPQWGGPWDPPLDLEGLSDSGRVVKVTHSELTQDELSK